MPSKSEEREKIYLPIFLITLFLVISNVYWYSYELFYTRGWHYYITDNLMKEMMKVGFFNNYLRGKLLALVFIVLGTIIKHGKNIDTPWTTLAVWAGVSLLVFFLPPLGNVLYILTTLFGYISLTICVAYIGRRIYGMQQADNDPWETFDQTSKKIVTPTSVNIPTEYQYKHRLHKGWLNIIQPQRAVIILGVPGSGKTYAVYGPIIEQFLAKGMPMFVYDYKYPSLTDKVYNEYLGIRDDFKKKHGVDLAFNVINFKDPRMSMRCNPLHPRYLVSQEDSFEVADIIWANVNPKSVEQEDFFTMSAKQYIDALVWFLRIHKDGKYCTFPHLIELMGRNYKAVFKMLLKHDEIRVKIVPFMNALQGNAMEQLMGQIATAQIALARFASPALYWVLSGDDFPLDYNNPDRPSIICMGNDPDRQAIYGTTLALLTSRMFKKVNHKKNDNGKTNLACGVLLDELPTIFLRGLDQLIATARENKVCIILGAQDKSQLIRDYKDKEADVILNTVGTVISGQVNGRTAKDMSEMFGKEFRKQQSETTGGDNDTVNTSFQLQELMPQSRIETMSQGFFFGKVADEFGNQIKQKLFCAKLLIDVKEQDRKLKERKPLPNYEYKFNLEGIEQETRDDPRFYTVQYIETLILEDEKNKERANREYERPADSRIRLLANERYDKMTDKEKEDLVPVVIEWRKNNQVEEDVKREFFEIKTDILEIFDDEGVEEYEDEDDNNDNNGGGSSASRASGAGGAPSGPAAPAGGSRSGSPEPETKRRKDDDDADGPAVTAEDADVF